MCQHVWVKRREREREREREKHREREREREREGREVGRTTVSDREMELEN